VPSLITFQVELFVHFFVRSKETNQRKGAQQLGLRLSSRNTLMRGRHELVPLLAKLKQRGALIRIHVLRSAALQRV